MGRKIGARVESGDSTVSRHKVQLEFARSADPAECGSLKEGRVGSKPPTNGKQGTRARIDQSGECSRENSAKRELNAQERLPTCG